MSDEGPARGTIPACAGEPRLHESRPSQAGDHPRVRGGTCPTAPQPHPAEGPSPRARGNRLTTMATARSMGTIPACAGEPERVCGGELVRGDHPRVRGGTKLVAEALKRHPGPSPRARGNPRRSIWRSHHRGTIPACAGEPPRPPPRASAPRDHPRVRGGTGRRSGEGHGLGGPSPRARGNRSWPPLGHFLRGTIPACAGEPPESWSECRRSGDHPRVRGGT